MWTNNIWEFLAIVHGLAYLDKIGSDKALYSDSKHAISRVEQKKCKTKLPETLEIADIFRHIQRAEDWLHTHRYKTQILKRHTKDRWEIPADFGRK
jgi:ribonuclease HI